MKATPFRAFVSFWLIVCMLFSFLPLGCQSVAVRHPVAYQGQPYLPNLTEERIKECAALVHKDATPEQRSVNANVTLDEDGRVQLIKRDVHRDFFHTGGMARARKDYGKCE